MTRFNMLLFLIGAALVALLLSAHEAERRVDDGSAARCALAQAQHRRRSHTRGAEG